MSETINITIKVWRQKNKDSKGEFQSYEAKDISTHMSFLEMLDEVNDVLIKDEKEPIAFDHDCREGICGSCSMVINGRAHGPEKGITACQLHMRKFNDGDTIWIEPWRAKAFPVLKDLVVDRTAFDHIMTAGGYVSVKTGGAPDGNAIPIPKVNAELAMDAAACIGCGACVAACKNASAMLFVSAKVSQYALLPQGQAERTERVTNMLSVMEEAGFGNCTNSGQCEAECPKEISVSNIARLNREMLKASISS
ncbi:succinate dehydrogenase/fumarate reductase iron-sulfur subunit [Candidatus Uabimicrobium sp. HlEnr_7]|uniref:succinate dehydrogenase/fumarate reductase iron-sulfur subunit n=1 Tax=Candidatus Uabimicrobium helgolandensis TaxID=3095367 RepID=UPI0035584E63